MSGPHLIRYRRIELAYDPEDNGCGFKSGAWERHELNLDKY